jgi:queuine tRNA-ribosyltransferase
MSGDYQLVHLNNGICSVRSLADHETFHPVVGPVAEAEALYVNQLQLRERVRKSVGEFVIWDVGLGAAANIVTALRATREIPCDLRVVSFDHTPEPLAFALKHAAALGYFDGYETCLTTLLREQHVTFQNGAQSVNWEFHLGDFPAIISRGRRGNEAQISKAEVKLEPPHAGCHKLQPPHAIFYDAFSPAKNPAMWTLPVFENLFRALDPQRPCALTTYSRSTMIRTALLLAGFHVGVGHATGMKEETTIAANSPDLIAEPLNARWLARAARSDSAEPLREPVYRREKLAPVTLETLRQHRQFSSSQGKESR